MRITPTPIEWSGLIKRHQTRGAWSPAEFAELMVVEQAAVSRWERGFRIPDLSMQRHLHGGCH